MKSLIATLALLLLSACYGSLERFTYEDLQDKDFHGILAKEYYQFALDEQSFHDWTSTRYFSKKAELALKREDILPEQPEQWEIPVFALHDLQEARRQLMDMVTPEVKEIAPEPSAIAYASYDCWVEEQHENRQTEMIALCRDRFFAALEDIGLVLGKIAGEKRHAEEEARRKRAEALAREKAAEEAARIRAIEDVAPHPERKPIRIENHMVLYFAFNSTSLSPLSSDIVKKIATTLKTKKDASITLNGHTDRSGVEKFNLNLSKSRADAVKDALVKAGFAESRIEVLAFGESDPAVRTPDGVKEPKNRRVEINIGGVKTE